MPEGDFTGAVDTLHHMQACDQVTGQIPHHRIIKCELPAFHHAHDHDGDDQLGDAGREEPALGAQVAGCRNEMPPGWGVMHGQHGTMRMARPAHPRGLRFNQIGGQLRHPPAA